MVLSVSRKQKVIISQLTIGSLEMWKVKKATSTMFLNLETYKKLKRLEFTSKQYFPLVTPVGHECTADKVLWLRKKVLFNIKIQPIHVTIKREIQIYCQIIIKWLLIFIVMSSSLSVFMYSINIVDNFYTSS